METHSLESDQFFCRMLLRCTLCVQIWFQLGWTRHKRGSLAGHSCSNHIFHLPSWAACSFATCAALHLHLKVGVSAESCQQPISTPGRLAQPLRSIAFSETRMISLAPPFAGGPPTILYQLATCLLHETDLEQECPIRSLVEVNGSSNQSLNKVGSYCSHLYIWH